MKRYILFTEEELDDMIHGSEIAHTLSNGETVYFMCEEHFIDGKEDEDPGIDLMCDPPIFETEDNANKVLNNLKEIITTYGVTTVADLYDIVGLVPYYIYNNYGWINVDKAEIIKVREGYELKMPRPFPIV